ncbi:MAG: AAA family ATPase [Planctomycetota bacterium]
MILHKLIVENFMPYFGRQEVVLSPREGANVIVVFGDNMGGKTSLLNAIRWCLYDTAYLRGGETKAIPWEQLLNRAARDSGDYSFSCSVAFERDGKQYELRRHAVSKSESQAPRADTDFEMRVSLYRDADIVSAEHRQALLAELFPTEIARFMLFDGELLQEYEELLEPGSQQGKKIATAIEQALGIPALSNGRAESAALKKKFQKQVLRDAKQVQGLEEFAKEADRLQDEIMVHERDLEDLHADDESTSAEISELDDKLKAVERDREQAHRLETLSASQTSLSNRQKAIVSERLGLMRNAWIDALQPRAEVVRSRLESQLDEHRERLLAETTLRRERAGMEKALSETVCVSCGQGLPSTALSHIRSRIAAIDGELETLPHIEVDESDLTSQIGALRGITPQGVSRALRRLDDEDAQLLIQLEQIESEMAELQEKLESFDSTEDARLRQKRDQLLGHRGVVRRQLQQLKEDIERKQKDLDRIASKRPPSITGRHRRSTALFTTAEHLEKIFNESLGALRDDLRDTVETVASEAFLSMTTDSTYRGLRINDQYGLSIIAEDGHEVPLRSAGAEQVVALSLIMALNATARTRGAVVMDTPFGRLDPRHRSNILKAMPQLAQQVVLLVHEGEMKRADAPTQLGEHLAGVYSIRHESSFRSFVESEHLQGAVNG